MTPVEGSTKEQIKAYVLALEAKVTQIQGDIAYFNQAIVGCKSCQHYASGRGCALAGGIDPPPEVKAAGCPAWQWDGIPF